MSFVAEYVSPGHPDRLCDSIVNKIVDFVVSKDKDALCGLECAVHTNKVFVDGRIAAGKKRRVINNNIIKDIIKDVYKAAGYGKEYYGNNKKWHPFPEELEIYLDVCIEKLNDEERNLREYSDDQNVVNGYAINSKTSMFLPVEHYVATKIGEWFNAIKRGLFGPDFKILVQIIKDGSEYVWERLTISVQHMNECSFKEIHANAYYDIKRTLFKIFGGTEFDSLCKIDSEKIYINGAGDFVQGGPEGDNGLSGKKLCLDYYGPSIPIGGGAIYGKDPHKVDVCGAFRARELAVKLVKEHNYYSVFTRLAWSPGETSPYLIEAYEIDEFGTQFKIDDSLLPPKDFFSIECINKDLNLGDRKITSVKDII